MSTPLRLIPLIFAATLGAASMARASETTCSERICDEQQIGPYVAPDIAPPDLSRRFDPRGRPIPVPVPGLEGVVVRHRPGAGVWIGEAPGNANLFVKPGREGVTVDMRVDF
jgi:hypothetical protein